MSIESTERAQVLRKALWDITDVPPDKSLHQVREETILKEFEAVASEAREAALRDEIYATGDSATGCVLALADFKGWGEVTDISPLDGGDPKYTWGCHFLADGTSMKAAGWEIPGGFILTWWK